MTAIEPRPRRSDATKTAILAAARERFAAEGYERATIRAIAADAGIDPAMVMRYYGSKDRLFAAAAEFDLRLPDVTAMPHEEIGTRIVGHFLSRWEEDETLMALLRAAVSNEAARERLQAIFTDQVAPVMAPLAPDPAQAGERAGLLATQMLGLALCRYVLGLPPIVHMSRADVVAWLAPTVQRYLAGDRT
ncbi:MAG TPA: TetR family transcriptional regulator [Streptosporangiaceae bacterium]|nr:TetR family transcriptional regulator [Streptosporangiaceae bacterium]